MDGDESRPLRWKFSADGVFTVKNGYNLALQWKLSMTSLGGETSNTKICKRVWGKLWKL